MWFWSNQTKINGGGQSERKVVPHDSKIDLPLVSTDQNHHICCLPIHQQLSLGHFPLGKLLDLLYSLNPWMPLIRSLVLQQGTQYHLYNWWGFLEPSMDSRSVWKSFGIIRFQEYEVVPSLLKIIGIKTNEKEKWYVLIFSSLHCKWSLRMTFGVTEEGKNDKKY